MINTSLSRSLASCQALRSTTAPQRIEAATMEILARAAQSALQLKNFPLGNCDVQCAFDCYFQGNGRDIHESVRANLALLGFAF